LGDVGRLGGKKLGKLVETRHRRPTLAPQDPAEGRDRLERADIMSHGCPIPFRFPECHECVYQRMVKNAEGASNCHGSLTGVRFGGFSCDRG
jgi:hypothetical protein